MLSAFEARKLVKPIDGMESPWVTEEEASTVDNFTEFIEKKIKESCTYGNHNVHFTVGVDCALSPVIFDKSIQILEENGYKVRSYGRATNAPFWTFEVLWSK